MVASRTVLVRIRADADQFNREVVTSTGSMRKLGDESDRTSDSIDRNTASIDRFSGRLKTLGQFAGALGPGLTPIIGATTQATAGLATQIGFTVLAAGSAIIAFQGVGDALKALSEARVAPTAANLAKVEAAMEQLSPAGQDLARTIAGLSDEWQQTKAIAQGGLFPGVEDSIDSMMTRLPELQAILAEVSTTAGDLLAEGADSLASERWDGLFTYLETSAKPILTDTAHTAGSLTHALSELVIAMDPLTRDFTGGLAAAADDFDKWATGLSQTEGFQDFVAYMRTEGPQVAETVGDIAGSVVSLLEAGSGAGAVTLDILSTLAETISTIADSPVGPTLIQLIQLVSILALLNRGWNALSTGTMGNFVRSQGQAVTALGETISAQQRATMTTAELSQAQASLNAQQRAAVGTLARGAAGLIGFSLAALNAQQNVTGLGTASGALMGFAVGGPWGAAIGAGIGLLGEFTNSQQAAAAETSAFAATLDQQTGALTDNSRAWLANQFDDQQLADLKQAGVDLDAMTTAILEGGDAYDQFAESARAALNAQQDGAGDRAVETFDKIRQTIDDGTASFGLHSEAVGETAGAYSNATGQVHRFTSALEELNGFLDKRAAWRAYEQSIDDANKALKKNGETLDINKAKGRENAAAIDDIIRNTGELASQLKGTARQEFLTQARQDIREMLREAGATPAQIQKIIDKLRQLDGTSVNTYINVVRRTTGGGSAQTPGFGPQAHASGGLVRGPGTRTSDEVPAWLSDYEYVQRAAAVDHYGVGFMDAVNDLRFPKEAPAVHPFTGGGGAGGGGGFDLASVVAALVITNQRLTDLQHAVKVHGPAATGRAVVDRLNEGLASEMRAAEL